MTRFMSAVLATGLVLGFGRLAVADDQDASAVIDKAVKALGGGKARRRESRRMEDRRASSI